MTDQDDRRASEREGDRRCGERRHSQLGVFVERRLGDRRRIQRRLVDVFRTFLGLPPIEK